MKIHISKSFRDLLVANGDLFEIEYRGLTAVKGKESMHTYWLLGLKMKESMVCNAAEMPESKQEEKKEANNKVKSKVETEEKTKKSPEKTGGKAMGTFENKIESKTQDMAERLKSSEDAKNSSQTAEKSTESKEIKKENGQFDAKSPSTETTPIQFKPNENSAVQKINSSD